MLGLLAVQLISRFGKVLDPDKSGEQGRQRLSTSSANILYQWALANFVPKKS